MIDEWFLFHYCLKCCFLLLGFYLTTVNRWMVWRKGLHDIRFYFFIQQLVHMIIASDIRFLLSFFLRAIDFFRSPSSKKRTKLLTRDLIGFCICCRGIMFFFFSSVVVIVSRFTEDLNNVRTFTYRSMQKNGIFCLFLPHSQRFYRF